MYKNSSRQHSQVTMPQKPPRAVQHRLNNFFQFSQQNQLPPNSVAQNLISQTQPQQASQTNAGAIPSGPGHYKLPTSSSPDYHQNSAAAGGTSHPGSPPQVHQQQSANFTNFGGPAQTLDYNQASNCPKNVLTIIF